MQVVMYTKSDCGYCIKVKELLNQLDLPFTEQIVGVDIASEIYRELYWPSVPCIIVDGIKIGGYEEFAEWAVDNNLFG